MKGGYWPDPKEHMVTERDLVKCTRTKRSQALATFPPNRYAMKFIIRSSVNWLVWSHASKQWNLYNFSSVCILFAKWFNGGIGSPRYYIPLVTFFLQLCNTASLEHCTAGNVGNESSNSVFISFAFAVRRRHSKSSVKLIKSRQTLRQRFLLNDPIMPALSNRGFYKRIPSQLWVSQPFRLGFPYSDGNRVPEPLAATRT